MSDNPKYEARVREIAEEMARADCIPGSRLPYDETVIQSIYVPLARIAVKHMVGTAERYYQHGWLRGKKGFPVATEEEIELDFIARGLIPTPERREAGENYAD